VVEDVVEISFETVFVDDIQFNGLYDMFRFCTECSVWALFDIQPRLDIRGR